jgi:hypothetical protein|tara:strand:- start:383 stop:640 length:258 start_codon:yes stop_codon:yes gene_type:complete
MPRGVIYDTFTEAQEYADRVNGEPMEVEGGFSVVSPLGYNGGGKVVTPKPISPALKSASKSTEKMFDAIIKPMIKGKGSNFKGTF